MPRSSTGASQLDYRPAGRDLDIEVFHFSDLRRRATPAEIRAPHRYTFHMLVCVTQGQVTQLVDFLPVACAPGSLLILRPGQVHSLGSHEGWDGWMVFFRSEFLPSEAQTTADLLPALGLDRLPDHLSLAAPDFHAVGEAIARMRQDATSDAPPKDVHALLRYQLCGLLLRLSILNDQQMSTEAARSHGLQRFARFRRLVKACSAFTRVAACTLARSPIRDPLSEGFGHFVTSMTAPVASGWSVWPGGTLTHWKTPPCHGHPRSGLPR